jgi:hypothetical protein
MSYPAGVFTREVERIHAEAESIRKAFRDGAMGEASYARAMDRLSVEAAMLDRLMGEIVREAANA